MPKRKRTTFSASSGHPAGRPARTTGRQAQESSDSNGYDGFLLDEEIAHLIRRAHQRASATFMSVLAEHQLTPAQFYAMARLREKGQLSQNLLGRLSAMDPATIQGVIRRLGERGFIQRLPDPSDRRRMILRLTTAGEARLDELRGGIEAVSTQFVAPLAPAEREQLRDLLKRIV